MAVADKAGFAAIVEQAKQALGDKADKAPALLPDRRVLCEHLPVGAAQQADGWRRKNGENGARRAPYNFVLPHTICTQFSSSSRSDSHGCTQGFQVG